MAIKVLIGTPPNGGSSGGDMTKAVYDPQDINADAFDRSNHTGEQAISTVTGLEGELDDKLKQGSNSLSEDLSFISVGLNIRFLVGLISGNVQNVLDLGSLSGNSFRFTNSLSETKELAFDSNSALMKNESGSGFKFNDRSVDEANVDFSTDNDNLLSIGKAKENLTKKALTQTEVNTTPKVIVSTDSDTTFNVYGVGALCEFTINTRFFKCWRSF